VPEPWAGPVPHYRNRKSIERETDRGGVQAAKCLAVGNQLPHEPGQIAGRYLAKSGHSIGGDDIVDENRAAAWREQIVHEPQMMSNGERPLRAKSRMLRAKAVSQTGDELR